MLDIIDIIRKSRPSERVSILEEMYNRNREFFASNIPAIKNFLDIGACPYHIDITERFLNIIDSATGELAHPREGLDRLAELVAAPESDVWVDLHDFLQRRPSDRFRHGEVLKKLNRALLKIIPDQGERIARGSIVRPRLDNGRFFSPPVIFVGIFHGLHVAEYLRQNRTNRIMLVEPELERFMVSCYFLDYQEVSKICDNLYIVLDPSESEPTFKEFFSWHHVTPQVWTRVLPGYPSSRISPVVQQLELLQKTHLHNVRPYDLELVGLFNSIRNLRKRHDLLTHSVKLSEKACILVVGSGPSLENDLSWIKDNQDRMIIFAVHSAVKILISEGICPDFQFSIDIHLDKTTVERLGLPPDIPLVATGKVNKELIDAVDTVLMLESDSKVHCVEYFKYVDHMYPTTGNMAIAFAASLKPSCIILAGMDLGFRKKDKRHAAGGFFGSGRAQKKGEAFRVPASLHTSHAIFTTGFLNEARLAIEAVLQGIPKCKKINLSDGAMISGTEPMNSATVFLDDYSQKAADVQRIISAFEPARSGVNWQPFKLSGKSLLAELEEMTISSLEMTAFDMGGFADILDSFLGEIVQVMKRKEGGVRMELYFKLLLDISALLYRFLLFAQSDEERVNIYNAGLEGIKEIFDDLSWPDELDWKGEI